MLSIYFIYILFTLITYVKTRLNISCKFKSFLKKYNKSRNVSFYWNDFFVPLPLSCCKNANRSHSSVSIVNCKHHKRKVNVHDKIIKKYISGKMYIIGVHAICLCLIICDFASTVGDWTLASRTHYTHLNSTFYHTWFHFLTSSTTLQKESKYHVIFLMSKLHDLWWNIFDVFPRHSNKKKNINKMSEQREFSSFI